MHLKKLLLLAFFLFFFRSFGLDLDLDKLTLEEQYELAVRYYETEKRPDIGTAIKLFEHVAKGGHVLAQYKLGVILKGHRKVANLDSITTITNREEAYYWFERAAEKGYPPAQYQLGMMYRSDADPNIRSQRQAVKWVRLAAEQNHIEAMHEMGHWYFLGVEGIFVQDFKKAFYWFEKSALKGYANAQSDLARMYFLGYGMKRDLGKALYWYEKAALQGHLSSQIGLVKIYIEGGQGVEKNYDLAWHWREKAISQITLKWASYTVFNEETGELEEKSVPLEHLIPMPP